MRDKTILLADDQIHILMLLETILRALGCRLLTARSGEETLTRAETTPIDLLLIDFQMSGLSGVETVCRLRENPRYVDLPVIMITGRGQSRIRVEAAEAGVSVFLSKPFSPTELIEEARRLLGVVKKSD